MNLTLPHSQAASSTEDAYVIENSDGDIIDRPIQRLNPVEAGNARPYAGTKLAQICHEVIDWFVGFTGTKEFHGKTRMNSLRAYAWIKSLKGFFPTRVTSLFSYVWAENSEGKKQPQGEPIAYRMWSVIPTLDLSVPENIEAFNKGQQMTFGVVPVSNAIGLKASEASLFDDEGKINTYQVPRLAYRNVVIVDHDVESDGKVIVTRVLANYYLRLQHQNRNLPRMPFENKTTGETGTQYATIFSGCTQRKMSDVTDSFLEVYNALAETDEYADADVNTLVHATLANFFVNPELSQTKLARVLQLQARSMAGAHVDALPGGKGSDKYENDLVDRCCMYVTETFDHYHGVDRTIEGRDAEDEFVDFHCKLAKLEDPLVMNAQRLQGRVRINDGVRIVMSE